MRTLFPVLILVATLAQSAPSPDSNKQQKLTQKKHAVGDQAPTPSPPTVINNQSFPSKQEGSSKANTEHSPEKSPWGDVPTWLLVIVGGVAAGIALRTLRDIKIQTQNAGIAARAAETSANAIIRSERPWLLVSQVRTEHIPWNKGRVLGAYFVVQNYGKSPAWVVNMGGTFETRNNIGELPLDPVYKHSANEEKRGIVIVPSSGGDDRSEIHIFRFPHNSLTEHADFQEVVNQKKGTWCIYGYVSYRDVFDMEHETRFCYKLDDWPHFRAVDAGPNYNRHT